MVQKQIFLILSVLTVAACAPKKNSGSSGSSSVAEKSLCTDVVTPASPTTVTSNAYYLSRSVSNTGLGAANPQRPIRNAEVMVLNSGGTVVQCGETNSSGAISVDIPSVAGTYTLQVNSRADNSYIKTSVLDAPATKKYYSVAGEFTIDDSGTGAVVPDLLAPLDGTLEGGAFNIYDQIYTANKYLRENSTDAACPSCQAFTVAPKSKVYWKKGFNPGAYFGFPSVSLSFYSLDDVAANRALYILGGINGDTDNSDTDHFDNSVIIHEYGHFLENVYAKTDSTGGSHNGNFVIDPRLAWGEGWANFFASAVQGSQYYRDTMGNIDGSTGLLISFNLGSTGSGRTGQDRPLVAGEGNFRELSVSRSLWRFITPTFANLDFSFLWQSFTSTSSGFSKSDLHFRSAGKFWTYLKTNIPSGSLTALNTILTDEFQDAETQDYARVLAPASCSAISLTGSVDLIYPDTGQARQNLQRSNDFYQYTHAGGVMNIQLSYTQSGTPITDLDLIIFRNDYSYDGATAEEVASISSHAYPEVSGSGQETVNVSLAAGTYMVNVRANTQSWDSQVDVGDPVTYSLYSNGVQLCPQ